jgi:hypothetical protein
MAKIDAVSVCTGFAMTGVVRVARSQQALEQLVPGASGRLNLLAEEHVLAVADVLQDLRRGLRSL